MTNKNEYIADGIVDERAKVLDMCSDPLARH